MKYIVEPEVTFKEGYCKCGEYCSSNISVGNIVVAIDIEILNIICKGGKKNEIYSKARSRV